MNSISRLFLLSSLIALTASAPLAKAGPGADYWKRTSVARASAPAETSPTVSHRECLASRTVEITETENAWKNGRGPLVTRVVGTKQVCTSCGGELQTVSKHAWANGKGPMVTSTVHTPHICGDCEAAHKS